MSLCQNTNNAISASGTLTNVDSDTIISAAAAAGREIKIVSARIVRGATSGAAIQILADADVICATDPVTFEGTLNNYRVIGQEITIESSGTGSAYYTITYRFL